MTDESTIEKLAERYRRNGYEVIAHPQGADVPMFLNGFNPDLIVKKGDENIIVQVTSRSELARDLQLAVVADDINSQPGWQLDVLMVGEDAIWPDSLAPCEEPSLGKIASMVESSRRLMSLGELTAACLVGWAAIEASMRAIAAVDGVVLEHKTPGFVLKTLYSQGILSREEFVSLERVMRICNAIAHGLEPGDVQEDALRLLLDCAARLLNLATRTAA